MNFDAYIFDMDGTLVDSQLDFDQLRITLGVHPQTPLIEEIETWSHEKKSHAYSIIDQHETAGAEQSVLYDGVKDFLNTLKRRSIPTALFTRNSKKATEITLKKHDLNFSAIITREDAPPKPLPDGLLRITQTLKVKPANALYIGDYIYDLDAGTAAKIPTALYTSTTAPLDFDIRRALFTFPCYHDLRKSLFASYPEV